MAVSAPWACFLTKWSSLRVRLRCQSQPSFICPPAWPPAQEGRMRRLDPKWALRLSLPPPRRTSTQAAGAAACGLLVSATVSPATSSWFANMPSIWLACPTHMSQRWEINLRARRCQAGDSCGLQFHQMSAVANLQQTWTGRPLHALYMHSKYFLNTKLKESANQNLFVTARIARAFWAMIYKTRRHVVMKCSRCLIWRESQLELWRESRYGSVLLVLTGSH